MLEQVLLVAHIAGLGYWLGSELVINSTYRYVCWSGDMPFAERERLMEHVMHVDQHVRYALVLQASVGTALAALYGYVPGGRTLAFGSLGLGAAWLAYIEIVHRQRHSTAGYRLAAIDRGSRYMLMALLIGIAFGLVGTAWSMPHWMRWKLGAFAGVMASGVGIRLALIAHFRTWADMRREGVTPDLNAAIRQTYMRATSVLILLWVFIAGIVALSLLKPV